MITHLWDKVNNYFFWEFSSATTVYSEICHVSTWLYCSWWLIIFFVPNLNLSGIFCSSVFLSVFLSALFCVFTIAVTSKEGFWNNLSAKLFHHSQSAEPTTQVPSSKVQATLEVWVNHAYILCPEITSTMYFYGGSLK